MPLGNRRRSLDGACSDLSILIHAEPNTSEYSRAAQQAQCPSGFGPNSRLPLAVPRAPMLARSPASHRAMASADRLLMIPNSRQPSQPFKAVFSISDSSYHFLAVPTECFGVHCLFELLNKYPKFVTIKINILYRKTTKILRYTSVSSQKGGVMA